MERIENQIIDQGVVCIDVPQDQIDDGTIILSEDHARVGYIAVESSTPSDKATRLPRWKNGNRCPYFSC